VREGKREGKRGREIASVFACPGEREKENGGRRSG